MDGVCIPDNDYAAAYIRSVKTTPDFSQTKFGPSSNSTLMFKDKYASDALGHNIMDLHSTHTGLELPSTYLSNIVSDIVKSEETNLKTGFFIIKNIQIQ